MAGSLGWTTGVNMADVNGDGWLDIYVCNLGEYEGLTGKNQLFINQQDGTFLDKAADYGLDFSGFSTQSAFFDYDLDGDLDMYLLTHSVHSNDTYRDTSIRREFHPTAGDRLYENRSTEESPHFVDVTKSTGIYSSRLGYGLGLGISDVDNNGCPDIYVGNDFHENDYLYLNQCDGTFVESLESVIGHTSHFSMGVDLADINQDGWIDIATMDMKPWREDILKTSEPPNSYEIYQYKLKQGFSYQYPRNTIQVNQGMDLHGQLHYAEYAQLLGMEATDWSWANLWADWDLDGLQDLFVTNGIYRRPNDMDYINFISQPAVLKSLNTQITIENLSFIQKMPQVPLPNRVFRQTDPMSFEEVGKLWGFGQGGYSNGAAYSDLDRDGDLDLVVNNLNAPASIYENLSDSLSSNNYLSVRLMGKGANRWGIGAKLIAYKDSTSWKRELFVVRGFQSSVEPILHFGLGKIALLDSVEIVWPDQSRSLLKELTSNQLLTVEQGEYLPLKEKKPRLSSDLIQVEEQANIDFVHRENSFVDMSKEMLIPRMLSREGPALAVGDVNGDELPDFFVGGAKRQSAQLFLQTAEGQFYPKDISTFHQDSIHEDVDAEFFDADGDLDLDLYVVSGGNEYRGKYIPLLDRLYINDGEGNFEKALKSLPEMYVNGSCVSSSDIDQDGDLDLFVGGRSVAGNYGVIPRSYILENDGQGHFEDVTEEYAESLQYPGLVTDAVWLSLNKDSFPDLIIGGEWMPLRAFVNKKGHLVELTEELGLSKTHGWWNTLHFADMDGDGDEDILAGNLGQNSPFEATLDYPCTLYLGDFDQNGSIDPIFCRRIGDKDYPIAFRDEMLAQLPMLKKKYTAYVSYANSTVDDIFEANELDAAEKRLVYTFSSIMLENLGEKGFQIRELPFEAQASPIYSFETHDINGDSVLDVFWGGNFSGVGPYQGKYDASFGGMALYSPGKDFQYLAPRESGFWVFGEVRKVLKFSRSNDITSLIISTNNGPIQLFRIPQSLNL